MKAEMFILELVKALSQTNQMPELADIPDRAPDEVFVGVASPPVQALLHLYDNLRAKEEESSDEHQAEILSNLAENVEELALNLARLDYPSGKPISGCRKGWELVHDPKEYVLIISTR